MSDMGFEKIDRQSVSGRVFSSLRQEIINGAFPGGSRLPSAAQLGEQFGVSVASVKSALQKLAALGLIEIKNGQGSFVLDFNPNRYLEQLSDFFLTDSDITQITEFRLFLEMAAVKLAISRGTEENFSRMEELLRRMDQAALANDMELHGKLDYEFHLEISRATGNNVFVLVYEVTRKMFRQHTTILNEKFFKKAIVQKEGDDVHWRLYRAIREKDLKTCRACYVEMLYFREEPPVDPD
ncbi:FadR/GntR family transcriptional regulator [Treponema primitia]|uniref:FadR/GntR family transcriptional regulator n=1 Tax=Treponema primitia TaxID=88058 RepID=UPI00025551B3|nr:FadR/GntR family transcriptional regulator [Treponema primitia]